jgi:hypothetical protein
MNYPAASCEVSKTKKKKYMEPQQAAGNYTSLVIKKAPNVFDLIRSGLFIFSSC